MSTRIYSSFCPSAIRLNNWREISGRWSLLDATVD
jgi:hypothetical protein